LNAGIKSYKRRNPTVDKERADKCCFVVTPVGDGNSSIRRAADGLIDSVIMPILTSMGYEVVASHRISDPGSITIQVLEYLLEAKLVIANLTGLNPNVMYEVGVRHCVRSPLVVLAEQTTKLPFDLQEERTLFYKDDMAGTEELKPELQRMIEKAILD